MTQSKARNNPHVIIGLLMICNSPTIVLFHYEATHSFISPFHAKSLNHKIEPLEDGMLISMALGEVFMAKFICRDCEIRIQDITLKVDLICLN